MPAEGGATLLLGIEGLAVQRITLGQDGARVAYLVTADEAAAACPACGVVSTSVKGSAVHPPAGHSVRRDAGRSGVVEAALAVPRARLPTRVVHRVAARGAGAGESHHPAAARVRRRHR